MQCENKTILVTCGAGFIGSAVIRQLIREMESIVINVDTLTYAGNLDSLAETRNHPGYHFEQVDICNEAEVRCDFRDHEPDAVMHLAAESHVDRSIAGPATFVGTNITGTHNPLEAVRFHWNSLNGTDRERFRFHHVSTEEVYGNLGPDDPAFTEETSYAPSSPYSANKAASDHLVRAWHRTYGLPVVITSCSNNYGPYQFPEKLIPLRIFNALECRALPVYGKGDNIRDWLYVEDHARALRTDLANGESGRTYNIGGRSEKTKLGGEEAVRGSGCSHLIFRTSWVFAARGENFIRTMLHLAAERDSLQVIDDQQGAPTGAELIADVTAQALPLATEHPELASLYHLVASGETTWHGYACWVIEQARIAGWPVGGADEAIASVPSEAFPVQASRPRNSRLDYALLERVFGLSMPDWQQGVRHALTEILACERPTER